MKYGVSIGRRQPMHRLHVDCIREIVEAGLEPIIIVGSTNTAESKLFDAVKNPLNFEQQQVQIRTALPFLKNPTILTLPDVGHLERWCESVVALLGNKVSESVMHYRPKTHDTGLAPSEPIFAKLGLKSWKTINKNPADDAVNSTTLRKLPIDDPALARDLAAPAYIKQLMREAREANPNKKFLENTPITMRDISLMRLWKETGSFSL